MAPRERAVVTRAAVQTAAILAAGIGSRLRPITRDKPKCMVRVGGLPILEHQLRAYEDAGCADIHVVAGFRADIVQAWVAGRHSRCRIHVIENHEFDTTNNMYSLFLLRGRLEGAPFLLSNGDVVFDPAIAGMLAARGAGGSAIAVDESCFFEESMKVAADPRSGALVGISKRYSREQALAVSIDCYRFSVAGGARLFASAARLIEGRGETHHWTEVAIDDILSGEVHDVEALSVDGRAWMEIDNLADLARADVMFSPSLQAIASARAFVFDLDGTLLLDGRLLPGAAELVTRLRRDRRVFFCTNNSSRSRAEHAAFLSAAGLPCEPGDIVAASRAAAAYLARRGLRSPYVLGTPSLVDELAASGLDCGGVGPDCVVVGFDTSLTFERAARATQLVASGRPYILTHADPACPTSAGPTPDAGALAAMIEAATGVAPEAVLGKPSPDMLGVVIDQTKLAAAEIVMVGDRIATDMRMARDTGCKCVLVLSGITTRRDVDASALQPDLILGHVGELAELITP